MHRSELLAGIANPGDLITVDLPTGRIAGRLHSVAKRYMVIRDAYGRARSAPGAVPTRVGGLHLRWSLIRGITVSGNPIIPTRGNRKFPTHH